MRAKTHSSASALKAELKASALKASALKASALNASARIPELAREYRGELLENRARPEFSAESTSAKRSVLSYVFSSSELERIYF